MLTVAHILSAHKKSSTLVFLISEHFSSFILDKFIILNFLSISYRFLNNVIVDSWPSSKTSISSRNFTFLGLKLKLESRDSVVTCCSSSLLRQFWEGSVHYEKQNKLIKTTPPVLLGLNGRIREKEYVTFLMYDLENKSVKFSPYLDKFTPSHPTLLNLKLSKF